MGSPDSTMRAALLRCAGLIRPEYMQTRALTQLTRIDISPHSAADLQRVKPEIRQQYDIVAIEPRSTDMFNLVSLL